MMNNIKKIKRVGKKKSNLSKKVKKVNLKERLLLERFVLIKKDLSFLKNCLLVGIFLFLILFSLTITVLINLKIQNISLTKGPKTSSSIFKKSELNENSLLKGDLKMNNYENPFNKKNNSERVSPLTERYQDKKSGTFSILKVDSKNNCSSLTPIAFKSIEITKKEDKKNTSIIKTSNTIRGNTVTNKPSKSETTIRKTIKKNIDENNSSLRTSTLVGTASKTLLLKFISERWKEKLLENKGRFLIEFSHVSNSLILKKFIKNFN